MSNSPASAKNLFVFFALAPGFVLSSGCMPVNTGSGSITSVAGAASNTSSVTVSVNPNGQTISPGTYLQLSSSGGQAPYSYAILTGQGTLSATGLYTATSSPSSVTSTAEISATDANGVVGYAGITISYPPIVISPSSITVALGSTFNFSASGGSGAYIFGLAYGAGTINSTTGLYTAPVGGSNDQIYVVDSNGDQAFSAITVGAGGVSGGSSTNAGCSLITATGDTAVTMNCGTGEVLGTFGQSGVCGAASSAGSIGTTSYSVSCTGATTTATGNAYCCASPARAPGSSYTRTITGSAIHYVQLYCGVGETILSATATCSTSTVTLNPTNLPDNSAGQQGYSINCVTATDTAGLSVQCQGTTPI